VPAPGAADQGVDRAGAARPVRGIAGAQNEGVLLQRQGDVGAAHAAGGELGREVVVAGLDGDIVQVDARLPRERGVDARRLRMADRGPEDGVALHVLLPACCRRVNPCLRFACRSAPQERDALA